MNSPTTTRSSTHGQGTSITAGPGVDVLGTSVSTVPPHDANAEVAVLSAMLLDPDALAGAVEALRPGDFYLPAHAELFTVMETLFLTGQRVDAHVLHSECTRRGLLARLPGGAVFLADLTAPGVVPSSLPYYARQVKDRAILRQTSTACLRGYQMAMSPGAEAEQVTTAVQEQVIAATTAHVAATAVPAADLLPEALERIRAAERGEFPDLLPTGYRALDDLIGGISPGQMIVVAGRPAMGKSVAALDMVRHVAVTLSRPAILFSLEMPAEEVMSRLLAAEAGVPMDALRRGTLTPSQWDSINAAAARVAGAPLHIDATATTYVSDIRAKCVRLQRAGGLDLIAIDYLQLLSSSGRVENRQVEVAGFSRSLKLLAKEVAPVLAVAQVNRANEARADKRPTLADLRESGQIESDADLVLLLHREDYYDQDSPRAGEIDLTVAKQRNGPTGVVTLAHQFNRGRLANIPDDLGGW